MDPAGNGRLDSIQVLRGLAAMAVVFNHAGLLVLEQAERLGPSYLVPSVALARVGAIGVDLFFVISGFVMALSAAKFAGGRGAAHFLAQRYNRIAPLFYLFCLVMLADRLSAGVEVSDQMLLNSVLFVPFFDDAEYSWPLHYLGWTLAFEFVFYLVVTLLIAFGAGRRASILLFCVAAMPLAGLLGIQGNVAWRMFTNPILWEFALGIAAYMLWRRGVLQRFHRMLIVAALLSAAGVALAFLADMGPEPFLGAGDTVDGSNSTARLLHWGLPAFVLFCAVIGGDRSAPAAGRTLPKRLGDASYSIYLSHLLVMIVAGKLIGKLLPPGLLPAGSADLTVLVLLVVSAAVGSLVYRMLEKPMLDYGQARIRRWFQSEKAEPHPSPAPKVEPEAPRRARLPVES